MLENQLINILSAGAVSEVGQSQLLGFDGKFRRSSCEDVKKFPGRAFALAPLDTMGA